MNILPKKRWHVRTKDNITRVRRDEAEAREKEQLRLEKLKYAESEARINFLRQRCGAVEIHRDDGTPGMNVCGSESQHINLFADFKTHIKTINKDLEKEQKEKRERYEKQIGYLTYLGQDTNEALKIRSWYEVAPKRLKSSKCNDIEAEKVSQSKYLQDPLTLIKSLLPSQKEIEPVVETSTISTQNAEDIGENKETLNTTHKKHKKEKKSKKKKTKKEKHSKRHKEMKKIRHKNKKSDAQEHLASQQLKLDVINRLRQERLEREAAERERQDALLNPTEVKPIAKPKPVVPSRIIQKYNSQFNPELAKQNVL